MKGLSLGGTEMVLQFLKICIPSQENIKNPMKIILKSICEKIVNCQHSVLTSANACVIVQIEQGKGKEELKYF